MMRLPNNRYILENGSRVKCLQVLKINSNILYFKMLRFLLLFVGSIAFAI